MNQVPKKDPLTRERTTFWQKIFCVRPDVKKIKYRFVLINEDDDENKWEREPNRVCDFITLTIDSPYKKYENFENRKDCIQFSRKHNRYIKYDINFVSKFFYNAVTGNIFIGKQRSILSNDSRSIPTEST